MLSLLFCRHQRCSRTPRTRMSNPRMQRGWTHSGTSLWDSLHVSEAAPSLFIFFFWNCFFFFFFLFQMRHRSQSRFIYVWADGVNVVCLLTDFWFLFFPVCRQVSCPYSEINLNKEGLLPDRLGTERPLTLHGLHSRGRRPDQNANTTTQTSSTPDADHSQNRYAVESPAQGP